MSLFTFILFIGIFHQYANGYCHHLNFSLHDIPSGLKSISCSDGISSCPYNETCCQLKSGQYGCCPLADAVCCTDHLHCCPHGYTCDVEHSRCQKGFEKSHVVVCPSGETSCADGETCCQLQSGDYSCCPLPDAVSCSDDSHCCPHGYQCNIEENKCEKGVSIPWFTKKAAMPLDLPSKLILSHSLSSLSTTQCPDDKSVCSEDTTCCELTNSSYGCCPDRRASCCSDKTHCCGDGYSCDESGSRCIRHISLTPLSIFEEQTCPDGITKCSLSSTCCPNKNNDQITYSCCPNARGVCCGSNGSSCCPYKYICDDNHLTCQLNETIALENDIFNQCGSSGTVHPPSLARKITPSTGINDQDCNSTQMLCSGPRRLCCKIGCTCLLTQCVNCPP